MFSYSGSLNNIGCRRSQRRGKKISNQNQAEFKIANHLKGENYLPQPLKQQIDKIQFLSQKTLNEVIYQPLTTQSYDCPDILNKMKMAANKQEQKFRTITFPIQSAVPNSNKNVFEQLIHLQANQNKNLMKNLQIFDNSTDQQYNMNEGVHMDLQKNLQFFNDHFEYGGSMLAEEEYQNQQVQYESLF